MANSIEFTQLRERDRQGCADLGTAGALVYYQNVLWALQRVASVWGGEVTPVITVSGGRVATRAIRLDDERRSWNGLRFTYGKNMAEPSGTLTPILASLRRWSSSQRRSLEDPGAVRGVDLAEIIGRGGRDGVAAIGAVAHAGIDGHAACRAADMVAVVAISVYRAGSEAHGSHLASLGSHIAGIGLALIIR